MDMLGQGAEWLARMRTKFASRCVTYQRGNSSASVRATPGRSTREVDDGNGLYTTVETRDELVEACELVLDGVRTLPAAGDRILEHNGVAWVVTSPAPGEDCYRFTDAYRNELRIHLAKVEDPAETPEGA